jgi:outer membrane lipoprotein-sorting protein
MKGLPKLIMIGALTVGLGHGVYGEDNVDQIVDRIDAVANQPQMTMRYQEVVVTARGVETRYVVEAFGKNGDEKRLTRYLEPPKVRGTSFLMLEHGDNIWAYFSSTGRVRLIAKHMRKQKMMGSEFTYEDMALSSIKRNYTARLLGEKRVQRRRCYVLELQPVGESSYQRLLAMADKENYVILQLDFFRPGDKEPYKTMVQGDVSMVHGVATPHILVMKNNETGAQTAMKILEVDYQTPLPQELFTTSGIQTLGAQ